MLSEVHAYCLLLVLSFFLATSLSAQPDREVAPLSYNLYQTKDYHAHTQNWAAVQDSTGRMYFANNHGVLRFDGTYWTKAPSLNGGLIRSLAKDSAGTIFWGGQNDFGFLSADSAGAPVLVSLAHLLPDSIPSYNNVWRILPTEDGIYFRTNDYFFRYQDGRIEVLSEEGNYRHASFVDGRIVVYKYQTGLQYLDGDTFTMILGSEFFSQNPIGGIISLDNGNWLILTYFEGLFEYDGEHFKPLNSPINHILKKAMGYRAIRLKSGKITLATIHSGLFVIDQKGNLVNSVHIEKLPTTGLYQDDDLGLWAMLDGGIARVEVESPFSLFGKESGINVTSTAVTRHRGKLLIGNHSGLFQLQTYPHKPATFENKHDFRQQVWSLLSTDHGLLIGAQEGLFVLRDGEIRALRTSLTIRRLDSSSIEPGLVLAGGLKEFRTLRFDEGEWELSEPVEGITTNTHHIVETPDSVFWLGSHFQGVTRIDNFHNNQELKTTRFTQEDGFPERNDKYTTVFWLQDHIAIGTSRGLYRIGASGRRVVPDSSLGPLFTGVGKDVYRIEQAPDGNWYIRSSDNGILKPQSDGGFLWDDRSLRWLTTGSTQDFHFDTDGLVWMVANQGVIRYDPDHSVNQTAGIRINFNSVTPADSDSLIFGGSYSKGYKQPDLKHNQRALRFRFSSTFYQRPEAVRYSYRLSGLDETWSDWTPETQKDYTNLSHGYYRFEVRAKDLYDNVSEAAVFSFSIPVPWHLSSAAMVFYFLAGLALIAGCAVTYTHYRTRKLQYQKEHLKKMVRERTKEIEKNLYEKELLLKEIHHRVKNNLQIITSLLNLQAEHVRDESALNAIRSSKGRVKSMSTVHEILYQNDDLKEVDISEYIPRLAKHVKRLYEDTVGTIKLQCDIAPVKIDLQTAIPLGLIINEVISNSCKHAFKNRDSGIIRIEAGRQLETLKLLISDNGTGISKKDKDQNGKRGSLGMLLVTDMTKQLKAKATLQNGDGTVHRFDIPIGEL
jgi:two-component sensor histidine kinase/ligand-binding sensor domain-containing protein